MNDKLSDFFAKNRKAIIVVIIIIVLIILWNKYGYLVARLFKPATQNNSPEALTDVRKKQIEGVANDIKQDIYETPFWGHDYTPYITMLSYYDNEIIYGADYYKNFLSNGVTMYDDIDGDIYPTGDSADKLMNKLNELGKGSKK